MIESVGLLRRTIIIDAAVHADIEQVLDADELVEYLRGGGGSNFCTAFDLLEADHFDGLVIALTDGDIAVPPTQPERLRGVIWAVAPGDRVPTTAYGERVEIPFGSSS